MGSFSFQWLWKKLQCQQPSEYFMLSFSQEELPIAWPVITSARYLRGNYICSDNLSITLRASEDLAPLSTDSKHWETQPVFDRSFHAFTSLTAKSSETSETSLIRTEYQPCLILVCSLCNFCTFHFPSLWKSFNHCPHVATGLNPAGISKLANTVFSMSYYLSIILQTLYLNGHLRVKFKKIFVRSSGDRVWMR